MTTRATDSSCHFVEWLKPFVLVFVCLLVLFFTKIYTAQARQSAQEDITSSSDDPTSFSEDYLAYLPLILYDNMPPAEFSKHAPTNGSTDVVLAPVLSWNASTYATRYEYCYDTSNDGNCSNWVSTGTKNYAGLSGLQAGTTYYWQVRSWNGIYGPTYADSSPTNYWRFTTFEPGVWILDNCSLYDSMSGSYMHLVCEIFNNTNNSITSISLDVGLYDSNGTLIGNDFSHAPISILHPQESGCVNVMFYKYPNFNYLQYSGSYYETTDRRPSLSITHHSGAPGGFFFNNQGVIANNSQSKVDSIKAISTVYIGTGQVVGCDYGYLNTIFSDLDPGQEASFNIYNFVPDSYAVTRYKLQADGFISSQTSINATPSERIIMKGGNKVMRLTDGSFLFQDLPEK